MTDINDPVYRRSVAEQLGKQLEGALITAGISGGNIINLFDELPEPGDFISGWNPVLWECVIEARKPGEFSMARFVELLKGHGFAVDEVNQVIQAVNKVFLYPEEIRSAVTYLLDRRIVLRSQLCVGEYLTAIDREPYATAGAHLELLQRQLADVATGARTTDTWEFGAGISNERAACVRTGIHDYDQMTGGFEIGAFGLIGARPSIGKSAALCTIAHNIASRGEGVGIFSLEMRSYALQCRMASARAYRPRDVMGGNSGNPYYEPFLKGTMPDGPNLRRMQSALAEVQKLPIGFDASKGLRVSDIRARTRRLKAHFAHKGIPLRAVFVDHIGHVTPEKNRGGNKTQEVTDISQGLMNMAGDLDLSVIALSQLSRDTEKRGNKRPGLADLRDSGSLEQDAAHVTFLYRDEYYAERNPSDFDGEKCERNTMELIVAKQRNGPVGTVKTFCEMGANAIMDRQDEFSARVAA